MDICPDRRAEGGDTVECTKLNCPMQAGTTTDRCGDNCPWRTTANEGDLISRAAAKKIVSLMICAPSVKIMAEHSIDDIPAVDAVPVVRCKDCKFRDVTGPYPVCGLDSADPCELTRNADEDDWFCADGERRDSE